MTLSPAALAVRDQLIAQYGPTSDVALLAEQAAVFFDRAQAAAVRVEAEGLTITNDKGTFRNPSLIAEQAARTGFLSAMRCLRQRPKLAGSHRPSKVETWWRDRPDMAAKSKKVAKYFS